MQNSSNCDAQPVGLEPICSFGILADVHYANIDDGYNFTQSRKRFYRRSLELVRTAISDWSNASNQIKFILQLGDLIDGNNAPLQQSQSAVETVRAEMIKLDVTICQLWGNHELYNFTRPELLASSWWNSCSDVNSNIITAQPGTTAFYHFAPTDGFRVVVLDVYEDSLLGYDEDSPQFKNAKCQLRQHNKNDDLNSPLGLTDQSKRFVQFNGGTSQNQISWLDDVLNKAQNNGEVVLVTGHIPIYPKVTDYVCLCWNYEAILQTLHRYPCVLAYFAGHSHDFAHSCDNVGIHHIVFPGIIETLPHYSSAHATVELYPDHVFVRAGPGVSPMSDIVMEIKRSDSTTSASFELS